MFGTINLESYFSIIANIGWAVLPLDHQFSKLLKRELETKKNLNLFKPAALANTVSDTTIRNDSICWLNEMDATPVESELLNNLTSVMEQLRNYFRISLTHFEAHYAIFPKGHYYHKHTDQKKNHNQRFFSFVIYLNENWTTLDGGQLLIYDQNDEVQFKMNPELGQMIIFRSDILHEVVTSTIERCSITGWMRTS